MKKTPDLKIKKAKTIKKSDAKNKKGGRKPVKAVIKKIGLDAYGDGSDWD